MMAASSKSQIDRLGERIRHGQTTDDDLRELDNYRGSFTQPYETVIEKLRTALNFSPTGRPAKSTASIIDKLQRESIRLTQIQDIAGCRIVVDDIEAQEKALDDLRKLFPNATIVDRRSKPSHGYRAIHFVARSEGKPIEIQIRTEMQHVWAELSEKLSDVIDPAVKYGGGPKEVQGMLAHLSGQAAKIEALETKLRAFEPDEDVKKMKREVREINRDIVKTIKALTETAEEFRGQK